ncbi:MAG TPA: ATP synthase F1 subunit gamma [Patescibacteria group bacterium]|nr:ATP synthase F1 subunit gamma [Patescibacteria group bacterium]
MAVVHAREIKARLQSIKNTKKITKAMELVSAAKMRKAVSFAIASRPYCTHLWDIMQRLRATLELPATDPLYRFLNPVTAKKEEKIHTTLVLFSSNRGLCGAFNGNIVKETHKYIQAHQNEQVDVVGVGKRGVSMLSSLGITVELAYAKNDMVRHESEILEMSQYLYTKFSEKKTDQILLAYMDFRSAVNQIPTIKPLLPYSSRATINEAVGNAETISEKKIAKPIEEAPENKWYIHEPSKYEILNYLIPRIAEVQLYQALLESNASEHSARMLAMKNASDAAGEMSDELVLAYNQARQAGITQEIAEISAGTAAIT